MTSSSDVPSCAQWIGRAWHTEPFSNDSRPILPREGRPQRLQRLLRLPLLAAATAPCNYGALRILSRGRWCRGRMQGISRGTDEGGVVAYAGGRLVSRRGGAPRYESIGAARRTLRNRGPSALRGDRGHGNGP